MKYTKTRVQRLIWLQDAFRDHVSNLVDMLGYRGSLETIDYISGNDLHVSTRWHDRCGGWETEDVKIPFDLIECELHEASTKINSIKEEKKREELAKQQEQHRKAVEKQAQRELAELARLKSKYEPTTNGETP
jgi:hypothetical protein